MNRSGIALPAIVVLAFLPVCARRQVQFGLKFQF
jgi:hypothetical protein